MSYSDLTEAFDSLTPQLKTLFIDARLAWCSGGALCGEVHKRICTPMSDEDPMTNDQ